MEVELKQNIQQIVYGGFTNKVLHGVRHESVFFSWSMIEIVLCTPIDLIILLFSVSVHHIPENHNYMLF